MLEKLLRYNERRRLHMAEILIDKDDWMSLDDLSKELNSSSRILKYDFLHFQEAFDDFTIETSHYGVRLVFRQNTGLKTLYKNVLDQSASFTLVETIFLYEGYTAYELADMFFISPSTLYRLIEHINEVAEEYGFQIKTNPCRIVGDEEKIRHYFIQYFYEKYTQLDWPYKTANDDALDNLLYFFIEFMKSPTDFAHYNIFKLLSVVNLVRYKNGHFVNTKKLNINFSDIIPDLNKHAESFKYFEDTLKMKVNNEFINQVFTPFVQEGYSVSYNRLMKKTKSNKEILHKVNYLSQLLDTLSKENDLPLPNKGEVIFGVQNATYFEPYDPRLGYVLYNRNQHFVEVIKKEFPTFYKQLYQEIIEYRKFVGLPINEKGINYLFYVLFTYWDKLFLELRKKFKKVKILIISNRHTSHSSMIKDFLEYEFNNHLTIDIYEDTLVTRTILEELDYDFIVANFPLPPLETKNSLCIENIPTFCDITNIQEEINDVLLKRMT